MSNRTKSVEHALNQLLETMFYVTVEESFFEQNYPDIMQNIPQYEVMQICRDIAVEFDNLNDRVDWENEGDYYDEISKFAQKELRAKLGVGESFLDDTDKMYDFYRMTRDGFLESYSYLSGADYEATRRDLQGVIDRTAY